MKTDEVKTFIQDTFHCILNWKDIKLDEMVTKNQSFLVAQTYLKKGLTNWLNQTCNELTSNAENIALFLCDENGNIGKNVIYDDIYNMLMTTDKEYNFIGSTIQIHDCHVDIHLPDNPIISFITGNVKTMVIPKEDIEQLVTMLKLN